MNYSYDTIFMHTLTDLQYYTVPDQPITISASEVPIDMPEEEPRVALIMGSGHGMGKSLATSLAAKGIAVLDASVSEQQNIFGPEPITITCIDDHHELDAFILQEGPGKKKRKGKRKNNRRW